MCYSSHCTRSCRQCWTLHPFLACTENCGKIAWTARSPQNPRLFCPTNPLKRPVILVVQTAANGTHADIDLEWPYNYKKSFFKQNQIWKVMILFDALSKHFERVLTYAISHLVYLFHLLVTSRKGANTYILQNAVLIAAIEGSISN